MLKIKASILAVIILLGLIALPAAAVDIAVERVNLNYSSMVLKRGETEIITASITPQNATDKRINWSSDNPKIVQITSLADVDGYSMSAEVKALAPGTATVTVTTVEGGKRSYCSVEVISLVENISVLPAAAELNVGESIQLAVQITPADATNQEVTWESTEPSIVTVDQAGVVKAERTGQARIVARSLENDSINGYCSVIINELAAAPDPVEETLPEPELLPESEPANEDSLDYNIIIIGALLVVIVIALIFIINSKRR